MGDLLPKGTEFLLYSVRWLIQLPFTPQTASIIFRDVFQQLANGHVRLKSFGNQGVQKLIELTLFRERNSGDVLIRISRQLQCHLYGLTHADHRILLE